AAVVGLIDAAVTHRNQMVAVVGINPDAVEVDVDAALQRFELLAAVLRAPEAGADRVDVIGGARVDANHRVVERSFGQAVQAGPGRTAVVAAEDAAGLEAALALLALHVLFLAEQAT